MNGWTVGWLVWLAYFGVLEGAAVVRSIQGKRAGRPEVRDTLSEHVWIWFGTDKATQPNSWAYVRRFVLASFLFWLGLHFLGGGQFV